MKLSSVLFLLLLMFAATSGNAFAAIDTAPILASISAGQVAGVAVAIAFTVAVWAIRGIKLTRRG